MGMCGAGKAEDRGEGRGKREEEGELGRTRTRVRRTRNSGGETNGGVCSQAHVRARWAPERDHLLNFVSCVPSLSDPSPSLGVEQSIWKPALQEMEPSGKSPDGRGQRTLQNERAS